MNGLPNGILSDNKKGGKKGSKNRNRVAMYCVKRPYEIVDVTLPNTMYDVDPIQKITNEDFNDISASSDHSIMSSVSGAPSSVGSSRSTGINDDQVAALELRQLQIIDKLARLREVISGIHEKCVVTGTIPKQEDIHDICSSATSSLTSVAPTAAHKETEFGDIVNIVVNANPKRPPLSILFLAKKLEKSYRNAKASVTCHVHSSFKGVLDPKSIKAFQKPVENANFKFHVIWRDDCLQLQVYRDEKERARNGHTKASLSLQDFLALETGFTLDKESHTLGIICQDLCVVLAFDNRERLIQWSVRIANNLGEGQHFLVQLSSAPSKSKLTPGPVKLHVTDRKFCLTAGIPPKLLGTWEVSQLRRYGVVDGRIVFEGGSRCGKGEGVHVLVPDPPQLNLIIDAFDMSSKGQLARAPSRRFGSVVDSPRKSMTSRLSEMRSLMITPTESTANLSLAPSTNLTVASSSACTTATAMMQAPRESRSAEALCTACGEHPQVNFNGGTQQSMWKSSDSSSSRCDLDNCLDNISLVHCPDDINAQKAHVSPAHRNNPLSQQNQPLQIAKPLPSAMERCLSCMSKLGQQGTQDILSPSWTMDLNSLSNSTGVGNGGSSNSNGHSGNSLGVALPQGSIGSGNSDRLSISSHGSSGGGGGGSNGAEFYGNYDTPRSVLVAEMRRGNSNGRCNTPPGVFQGGNGGNNCHFSSTAGQPPCGSPYRRPAAGSCANGQTAVAPGGSNNMGCGVGNCHCQRGPVGVVGVNNSHIYYNSVAEQQHTNNKSHKAPNLHPGHLPGPYENYDFPRCVQPPPQGALSLNSYPSYSGESVVSGCVGSNGPSSIDWAKKPPMDRSSVATTASLLGSDSLSSSEFYDTPRQLCPCCAPTTNSGCPCCVNHSNASTSVIHGIHPQQQHHHMQQQHQPLPIQQQQQQHSHYQNPSCIMRRGDPMENYDVPPHNNPHNVAIQSQIQQMTSSTSSGGTPSSSISINGEGKMPLVAGSMNNGARPNPHAIYAQVDKSKKTPRPIPPKQHQPQLQQQQQQHIYSNNCDTHPIYENRNAQLQSQPTYINLPSESLCHNNVSKGIGGSGKPLLVAPDPNPAVQSHTNNVAQPIPAKSLPSQNPHCPHGHSNYVNLDFAESLQLYENAKEISSGVVASECPGSKKDSTSLCLSNDVSNNANVNATTTALVHAEPLKKIETIVENEYENTNVAVVSSIGVVEKNAEMGESAARNKEKVEVEEDKGAAAVAGKDEISEEKSSCVTSRSNSLSVDETLTTSVSVSGGSDGRRGSNQEASSSSEEAGANLPLRRSSSVPCKGGHANRGSASSSDSGVSGDGGLFFDDSSPLNDMGSLCLHESLPRKSTHRNSPSGSNGKNTSSTTTPRPAESEERDVEVVEPSSSPRLDPLLANRHYETIDEVEAKIRTENTIISNGNSGINTGSVILSNPVNPIVAAVKKCADPVQKRNLVSDANSTSSGNSDMSDYIETLSSCSRGSADTLTSVALGNNGVGGVVTGQPVNLGISASPKKSTSMKPRSGKEYFKIDRSMFKND